MNGYIITGLGLIVSALGVYIAASFTLAQKQLMAATRLQAYLIHYGRLVADMDAFKLLYVGQEWDREEQAIVKRGGSGEELLALSNEKKKLCDQIVEAVKSPEIMPDSSLGMVTEVVSRFKRDQIQALLDSVKVGRQNMLTGQTFITDEEAACLGTYAANNAIALKMGVIELMDGLAFLLARHVGSEDAFDPKNFMTDLLNLFWRATNVARDYSKLRRMCQSITSSSVIRLTWRNIRQGSRISRR